MLGDIFGSTQLLITHLVTTFSVGAIYDILGIYLARGVKQQNELALSSLVVYRVKQSKKP